jgi:hypothetical protein
MEKAYDAKELLAVLRSKGLVVAEDAAHVLTDSVFQWLTESAVISANPYDNMALIVYPEIKKFIDAQIDKIDGKIEA